LCWITLIALCVGFPRHRAWAGNDNARFAIERAAEDKSAGLSVTLASKCDPGLLDSVFEAGRQADRWGHCVGRLVCGSPFGVSLQ
jgi:hypothetical protein